MVKSIGLLLCLLLSLNVHLAQATEKLSATARLRKLSLSLRGLPPSPAEYADILIKNISVDDQEFFKKKAEAYGNDPQFIDTTLARFYDFSRLDPSIQSIRSDGRDGDLYNWL